MVTTPIRFGGRVETALRGGLCLSAEAAVDPVSWFWIDRYDRKIQMAGRIGPEDEMHVSMGSLKERRFAASCVRVGRLVGVIVSHRRAT
ncbi:MAG: hypothetical protein OXB92_03565 [Acidimicrobiaceae bacterium]|nr:hypothetical protein [Acidimicrobiia bacterium]MCY4492921.1 hypothetical protein [Acidimicrobiaceae bacterium]